MSVAAATSAPAATPASTSTPAPAADAKSAPTAAKKVGQSLVTKAANQLAWRNQTSIGDILKRQQLKASGKDNGATTATAATATAAATTSSAAPAIAATGPSGAGASAKPAWWSSAAVAEAMRNGVVPAGDGSIPTDSETQTHVFEVWPNHPPLRLKQRKDFGISGWVWPAAMVFIKYLIRKSVFPPSFWASARVLELGSGTGLVGLVCAWCGAKLVTLTDIALNTPLLWDNVKLNCESTPTQPSRVAVVDYLWNSPLQPLIDAARTVDPTLAKDVSPYNVVIGSDLCYKPEFLMDLYQSFVTLAKDDTIMYLAHEHRNPTAEAPFFAAMEKTFILHKIPSDELDEKCQADDISIFKITKRTQTATAATGATAAAAPPTAVATAATASSTTATAASK